MEDLTIIVLEEESAEGKLPFFSCAGERGVWESKARYITPILSARSEILERREGMWDWRCWILGMPGSLYRVEEIDIKMLSMWRFASYLSDIHLHTSRMTCLGLSVIS